MIKFIIMGQPRGGSTAMRTAVASHSQVFCVHEILHHRLEARRPNSGVKGYSKLSHKEAKSILDKLTAWGEIYKGYIGFHYNFDDNNTHNDLVKDWADKVVIVDRQNQYDRWKSFYFAVTYHQWHDWIGKNHNPDSTQPIEDITLPQSEIDNAVKFVKKNKKSRQNMLGWADGCHIDYEALCQNPSEQLRSVQDYLGLSHQNIAPRTKRFKPRFFANEAKVQQAIALSSLDDLPVT